MSLCTALSRFVLCSGSARCGTGRHAYDQQQVLKYVITGQLVGLSFANFTSSYAGRGHIFETRTDSNGLPGGGFKLARKRFVVHCQVGGGSNLITEEWTKKLPAKRKALYSHSLPCIEAWLQTLGFVQSIEDRAIWNIERVDWHAQLSLDVTDLFIRYLRKGPGKLERDIERKFSYALSREDLENAILGGP